MNDSKRFNESEIRPPSPPKLHPEGSMRPTQRSLGRVVRAMARYSDEPLPYEATYDRNGRFINIMSTEIKGQREKLGNPACEKKTRDLVANLKRALDTVEVFSTRGGTTRSASIRDDLASVVNYRQNTQESFEFDPSDLDSLVSGCRALVRNLEKADNEPSTRSDWTHAGPASSVEGDENSGSASIRPLSESMTLQRVRDRALSKRPEFKR